MSKVSEPFAGYADFDDCVAKNSDKSDPAAYCAVIKRQVEGEKLREAKNANVCGTCNWVEDDPKEPIETCPLCGAKAYYVPVLHPQEAFKHPDFQKIQSQFIQQCGEQEGLQRYQEWVDRLGLDESKSYMSNASMREKFQWIQRHADFRLWKEDTEAKYWRVEAGFPVESMNENVYTKEELTRAARTIKGKTINLNHKFSLPTIEILAGEYESDIVECVVRVPNSLHCPICDRTKTINDLIESGGIVNVSLEASCDYGTGPHGECEGMNFTGLSLLTKDVLPGIPLTRLMPLESIMVEALQVNETKTEVKKMKKLEAKIVENKEADYPWDQCISDMKTQGYDDDSAAKACAAIKNRTVTHAKLYGFAKTDKEAIDYVLKKYKEDKLFAYELDKFAKEAERDIAPTVVMPDAHNQCPEGMRLDTGLGQCVKTEECPQGEHFDQKVQQCIPDTQEDSVKVQTVMGTQPGPNEELTPLEEKVNRIKAEIKAKTAEEQAVVWEKQFTDLDKKHHELLGKNAAQEKTVQDLRKEATELNEKRLKLDGDLREEQNQTDKLHRQIREMQKNMDELNNTYGEVSKKYNSAVGINLELSKKLTKANEDYLDIASKNELLEAALNRSQIQAKKIIRIRP
jgi:hypothetical protein